VWKLQIYVRLATFAFVLLFKKPEGPENLPDNDISFLVQYFIIYDNIFWIILYVYWWDLEFKENYRKLQEKNNLTLEYLKHENMNKEKVSEVT